MKPALPGFTAKAIIVALVGLLILSLLSAGGGDLWTPGFGRSPGIGPSEGLEFYFNWTVPPIMISFGMAMLLAIIIAALNQSGITRFTRQEVALIMVMVPLGGLFSSLYYSFFGRGWFAFAYNIARLPPAAQEVLWESLPDVIFGPKDAAFWTLPKADWLTAGVGVMTKPRTLMLPWIELSPMILSSVFFTSCMAITVIFACMLMRYLYCRVEYLASPWAEISNGFVELTQHDSKKVRLFKSKYFLAAFLLVFVYTFALWAPHHFVSLATGVAQVSPEGSLFNVYLWPLKDITPLALLPWVPLYVSLTPIDIGWSTLLPVNVLVGGLLGWLVLNVIFPLIMASMGYWEDYPSGKSGLRVHIERFVDPPGGADLVGFFTGMLAALVVVPLWQHRHAVAPIFKALFRKPDPSFDPDKPMSYRTVWLLTFSGGLLWFLFGNLVMKLPAIPLLIFMFLITFLFVGAARFVAETGGFYGAIGPTISYTYGGFVGTSLMQVFPAKAMDTTSGAMSTYYFADWGNAYASGERFAWYGIHSMRVSDLTKTRSRDTLKVLVSGTVISLLAIAVFTWVARGISTIPAHQLEYRGDWSEYLEWAESGRVKTFGSDFDYPVVALTMVIIGFASATALTLLQARTAKLRFFNIAAVGLGCLIGYYIWLPFLVGLTIKFLTLKVGGVRLYEDKVKPICFGAVAAHLLVMVLYQFSRVGIFYAGINV